MPRYLLETDCDGQARLVFLLVIEFAGIKWYLSSFPVDVTDGADTLHFRGGLTGVEYSEGCDLASQTPETPTAAISVLWPESVAALMAQGHRLAECSGELSVLVEGADYGDRMALVTAGRVRDPRWGGDGEPVSFSLESDMLVDRNFVMPEFQFTQSQNPSILATVEYYANLPMVSSYPGQVPSITETSQANSTEPEDQVYPLVFGSPGARPVPLPDSVWLRWPTWYSGSPCYVIDAGKALIAGHRCRATTVNVWNASLKELHEDFAIASETDGNGRVISYVDFSAEITWSDTDELWCIWEREDGGAHYCPNGQRALEGGGDILHYMLSQSSALFDVGATDAVRDRLNTYIFAGYVGERISPLDWVQNNLMPCLPACLASGPGGIYPILWPLDATESDAVVALEAGRNAHRESTVAESSWDLANELTISFAADAGSTSASYTITGAAYSSSVEASYPILDSHTSSRLYGPTSGTLDTVIVYDDSTAIKIAQDRVRLRGLPHRSISVFGTTALAWLRPGHMVTWTDSSLAMSGVLAMVERKTWSIEEIKLSLIMLANPARDTYGPIAGPEGALGSEDYMGWIPLTLDFIDAPSDDVVGRLKAPPSTSIKAIRVRASDIPTGGTIQVERDNDDTCLSVLVGGLAVNATSVTPANDELDLTLHATTARLDMSDNSWIKVTLHNLELPTPATDSLVVSVLFGV